MSLRIVESIHGTWHYHLTDQPAEGSSARALCGARTMHSHAPLDSWGYKPPHMPSNYCRACAAIAGLCDGQPPPVDEPARRAERR